jgi:hypothetical protein
MNPPAATSSDSIVASATSPINFIASRHHQNEERLAGQGGTWLRNENSLILWLTHDGENSPKTNDSVNWGDAAMLYRRCATNEHRRGGAQIQRAVIHGFRFSLSCEPSWRKTCISARQSLLTHGSFFTSPPAEALTGQSTESMCGK